MREEQRKISLVKCKGFSSFIHMGCKLLYYPIRQEITVGAIDLFFRSWKHIFSGCFLKNPTLKKKKIFLRKEKVFLGINSTFKCTRKRTLMVLRESWRFFYSKDRKSEKRLVGFSLLKGGKDNEIRLISLCLPMFGEKTRVFKWKVLGFGQVLLMFPPLSPHWNLSMSCVVFSHYLNQKSFFHPGPLFPL